MQLLKTISLIAALAAPALAAVDEDGNFVETGDLQRFMPPPIEDDFCFANGTNKTDMSKPCDHMANLDKEPNQEKILKLLLLELGMYNSYKIPNFISFYEYERVVGCHRKFRLLLRVRVRTTFWYCTASAQNRARGGSCITGGVESRDQFLRGKIGSYSPHQTTSSTWTARSA